MWAVFQKKPVIISDLKAVAAKAEVVARVADDEYEAAVAAPAVEAHIAAEIHFVDKAGFTVGQLVVPVTALRQARLADIPKARAPSPAMAFKLGYT
jgi:hypothetical protein